MTSEVYGPAKGKRTMAQQLDAVGWGLFFTWIGIALLADVGWSVGLIGVGIIMVAAQVARRYFRLPLEGFGLVVGLLLIAGGVWLLVDIPLSVAAVPGGLVAILCIVLGVTLLASTLLRRPRSRVGT